MEIIKKIYLIAEIVAFIVGCYCYKSLKDKPSKCLVYLLFYVLITEQVGRYFREVLHKSNVEYYNVSTAIEFLVYFYLFSKFFERKRNQLFSKNLLWFYPIVWLINILFIQGFHRFHTYSLIFGSVLIILLCCMFFLELLSITLEVDITKYAPFWLCTGLLFFYTGIISSDLLITYFNRIRFFNGQLSLYKIISNILNLILYSGYIMYFVCYHRNRNISSSY